LVDQRASANVGTARESLRLGAAVVNRLPVALTGVELGVVLAATPEALAGGQGTRLYDNLARDQPRRQGEVAALRRRIATVVAVGGSTPISLSWPLQAVGGDAPPQAFAVHLLAYRMARADAALLLDLLSGSAADEASALWAVGLAVGPHQAPVELPDTPGRLDPADVARLIACADAAVPAEPDEHALRRRLFCMLALGRAGGPGAQAILETLAGSDKLAPFNEALQVLRAARLVSGPWEAPLAHALPATARLMSDVAATALGRVPAGDTEELPLDELPARPGAPAAGSPAASAAVAAAVGLVVGAALWLAMKRRRRARSPSDETPRS